eukprot:m.14806 g.14806  ORF g.14806 m.14806 type:complete len:452 (-) comp5210_c0_seq1:130-1485(-)
MSSAEKEALLPAGNGNVNSHGDDGHAAPDFLPAGSRAAGIYTLSAMSLGVGVFVLPGVMYSMGMISCLFALFFFAAWSYWMQMALIDAAKKTDLPHYSYEALTAACFGDLGRFILAFFVMVSLTIGNAAHMKTVVLTLHDLMEWYITGDYGKVPFSKGREMFLYIMLLALAFVLSIQPNLDSLRYVSTASVTVVLLTCLWACCECMFFYWPLGHHVFTGPDVVPMFSGDWKQYASGSPAIAFAFTGVFCLFPVMESLRDQRRQTKSQVVWYSSLVCCVGYQVISVIGVLTFGKKVVHDDFTNTTAPNFLYVFPPNHYVMTLLCFGICVVITLLYAIINFPIFNATQTILEIIGGKKWVFTTPKSQKLFRSVTTLVGMAVVVLLNLQFQSLVTLFGLCGGYGITFVAYAIPSAIALKLGKSDPLWYKMLLVASILLVLVIAGTFTYVELILS